jgi:hypothetical protein
MDKRILLPLVILPAFQTGNMQAADQPAKRPNIILFMVDDMGWEDTSLPFWTEKTHYNEVYETPNMERLARQGVMFTQAYASSISSPSRCSLITGTNAARHRVTNWTQQRIVLRVQRAVTPFGRRGKAAVIAHEEDDRIVCLPVLFQPVHQIAQALVHPFD